MFKRIVPGMLITSLMLAASVGGATNKAAVCKVQGTDAGSYLTLDGQNVTASPESIEKSLELLADFKTHGLCTVEASSCEVTTNNGAALIVIDGKVAGGSYVFAAVESLSALKKAGVCAEVKTKDCAISLTEEGLYVVTYGDGIISGYSNADFAKMQLSLLQGAGLCN